MVSSALEKKLFRDGYKLIAGIDEAGRGPLAGPVVAACVACQNDFNFNQKQLRRVNDSKKISEKNREELFEILQSQPLTIGVGVCNHKVIDKINILQATFLAMSQAVARLASQPDYILIDGRQTVRQIQIKQQAIVRGDSKIFLIAAASIIAKVTRDRLMRKLHEQYPEYNFLRNKGYGTKEHFQKIKIYGPCSIHRQTFLG